MFIITTAEPLSAFLMVICGLTLRIFNPLRSSFVRLSYSLVLNLLFKISCLIDL